MSGACTLGSSVGLSLRLGPWWDHASTGTRRDAEPRLGAISEGRRSCSIKPSACRSAWRPPRTPPRVWAPAAAQGPDLHPRGGGHRGAGRPAHRRPLGCAAPSRLRDEPLGRAPSRSVSKCGGGLYAVCATFHNSSAIQRKGRGSDNMWGLGDPLPHSHLHGKRIPLQSAVLVRSVCLCVQPGRRGPLTTAARLPEAWLRLVSAHVFRATKEKSQVPGFHCASVIERSALG